MILNHKTGASAMYFSTIALTCTMHISVLFFLVQLIVACCRSYSEYKGEEQPQLTGIMISAASTIE